MIVKKLSSAYNQVVVVGIEDEEFQLSFRSFRNLWYCTITNLDGRILAANIRCVNNRWLMPWRRNARYGNFRFEGYGEKYIHPSDISDIKISYYYPEEISEIEE